MKNLFHQVAFFFALTIGLSSCGSPNREPTAENKARTDISQELDERQVVLSAGKLAFRGMEVEFDSREYPPRYGGRYPPKILPSGIHGYQQTELIGGEILVTGGYEPGSPTKPDQPEKISDATYFWNQAEKSLQQGPPLTCGRAMHTVLRLYDGRLMLIGGISESPTRQYATLIEIIDPRKRSCVASGRLKEGRLFPAVMQVDDAKVVIAGGQVDARGKIETDSVELYDLDNSSSQLIGRLCFPRQCGLIARVSNKSVLLIGGYNSLSQENSRSLAPELVTLPKQVRY